MILGEVEVAARRRSWHRSIMKVTLAIIANRICHDREIFADLPEVASSDSLMPSKFQ